MADYQGKTPITPEDILASELYGVLIKARGEDNPFPVEEIGRKLRAAEDFYERDLAIFFKARRVASDPQRRGLVKSTDGVDGDYDYAEPAYPFERDWFGPERWGLTMLNRRPVRSIDRMFIQLPTGQPLGQSGFVIDPKWIVPDFQYGEIRLLPFAGATLQAAMPQLLALYMMGSQTIPHIVYVDYTAGFDKDGEELVADHNDLLEGVRLLTTLFLFGVLTSIRTGGVQSQSLSEDGLSRSQSFMGGKFGPYTAQVTLAMENEKQIRSGWKAQEEGVLLGVA
jgi:hypothetical protein